MKSERRKPLAERLKTGLEEAIRHARGEISLRTTTVELPDEPPEIDAPTLVAIRDQSRMSQAVFARLLNVSTNPEVRVIR
jgi:DNA-binding transcriptional regulator YiaG